MCICTEGIPLSTPKPYIRERQIATTIPLQHSIIMKSDEPTRSSNFFCAQCEKSFRDNYNLRVHLKAHQKWDGKGPTCSVCHKSFPTPNALRSHGKTHETEAPPAPTVSNDAESSEEECTNEWELTGFAEVRCHICEITIGSISFQRHMQWHERLIEARCDESRKQLQAYLDTLQLGQKRLKELRWKVEI